MDCHQQCCNIGLNTFIFISLYVIISPINSISNMSTLLCLCYGSFSNKFSIRTFLLPFSLCILSSLTHFWAALTPTGLFCLCHKLLYPDINEICWHCLPHFTDCMNSKFNPHQIWLSWLTTKGWHQWGFLRLMQVCKSHVVTELGKHISAN